MKTITNKFKLALVAVGLLAIGSVSAQRTDTSANAATDFTKQANTVLGEDGGSVKVIDNKGTIKYLQASNGVTVFTDTAPDGGVITTWQLGGTLTDETYIDVDGNVFGFNGIETATTGAASTITSESDGTATATETGWSILVREEATGKIQKLLATDLISSGNVRDGVDAGEQTANAIVVATPGLSTNINQIWVYRNGAKLLHTADFTIDTTTAGSETVTITGNTDFTLYTGDVIEVQWVK